MAAHLSGLSRTLWVLSGWLQPHRSERQRADGVESVDLNSGADTYLIQSQLLFVKQGQ